MVDEILGVWKFFEKAFNARKRSRFKKIIADSYRYVEKFSVNIVAEIK